MSLARYSLLLSIHMCVLKAGETIVLRSAFYHLLVRHANGAGTVEETSVYYGIILYLAQLLSKIHSLVHRISLFPSAIHSHFPIHL